MFPLIAIAAFFILGIAFFVIGKDDFGIKRVKVASDDTSVKRENVLNLESALNDKAIEEKKELISTENSSEIDSASNTSD